MNAFFTKKFKKSYSKRIQGNNNLELRFEQGYDLFVENQSNEVLKDHPLSGKLLGYHAFSVTGDIRVVYYIEADTAYFIDIGTHNQVYGK